MSKMLKWALASGRMVLLFAILLSTTSQRKLFCLVLLTGEKKEGKRVGVGVLGITHGHTELWPLWVCDIDIWT